MLELDQMCRPYLYTDILAKGQKAISNTQIYMIFFSFHIHIHEHHLKFVAFQFVVCVFFGWLVGVSV